MQLVVLMLFLGFTSALVAIDETEVKDPVVQLARRRGESEASYQARVRAAERARRTASIDRQQTAETDEAYQLRLRTTIKGLLDLCLPIQPVIQRDGESQASYQARIRAAERSGALQNSSLMAYPYEEEIAYRSRLKAWKESYRYASLSATDLHADYPEEREEIEHSLQEVFTAAENRDYVLLDKYHFYGPKFTKFSGTLPERLDADTCRRNEHEGLAAITDLEMQANDLKIDVFGHVGIATFVLDYSFDSGGVTVHKSDRTTLVFVKDGGIWKITHEHLTPMML